MDNIKYGLRLGSTETGPQKHLNAGSLFGQWFQEADG